MTKAMVNRKSGFGLIGILIVMAVIIAAAGGGFYFKESQKQKSLLETGREAEKKAMELKDLLENKNAEVTTYEIDTSNWKTYRNEKYGFEFRYPMAWSGLRLIKETQLSSEVFKKFWRIDLSTPWTALVFEIQRSSSGSGLIILGVQVISREAADAIESDKAFEDSGPSYEIKRLFKGSKNGFIVEFDSRCENCNIKEEELLDIDLGKGVVSSFRLIPASLK